MTRFAFTIIIVVIVCYRHQDRHCSHFYVDRKLQPEKITPIVTLYHYLLLLLLLLQHLHLLVSLLCDYLAGEVGRCLLREYHHDRDSITSYYAKL